MALNLSAIGTVGTPIEKSWTSKDALLYAVGVGAGYPDSCQDLALTTENSRHIEQQVLPTFGVALALGAGGVAKSVGPFNPAMLVHAEQAITLQSPLKCEGTVVITSTLADIIDKRSGALVITESSATYKDSGEPAFTTRSGMFIRGEGGFGEIAKSDRAATPASPAPVSIPDRDPDDWVEYTTLTNQALIYRLSGDRNPLHSDPSFAARAGFSRPILHGLCTYGFTGRALVEALCDSDATRLSSMAGRFTHPVMPGQKLRIAIWRDESGAAASFRTTTIDDDAVVIDRGRCTYT